MADKLTPKQAKFIEEYLIDLNATQAAIRAGYSQKTARQEGARALSNVNIQRAIMERTKERTERTEITQDWVLTKLKLVAERCLQEEMVLDREGNPTGEYKFSHAGANRALELLGKHMGMFTDKMELAGKDGEAIQVQFSIPRPKDTNSG